MNKLIKNLIYFTVLSTLIMLPSSYLSADENDLVSLPDFFDDHIPMTSDNAKYKKMINQSIGAKFMYYIIFMNYNVYIN